VVRTRRRGSDPRADSVRVPQAHPKMHETQGMLDLKDPNMDSVLEIYDLGVEITQLIARISDRVAES